MRLLVTGLFTMSAIAHSSRAYAYCYATTCDVTKESCPRDQHNCQTNGAPLHWIGGTMALSVDTGGSELRGISGDQLEQAVAQTLATWVNADCGGGTHPALSVGDLPVDGGVVGYDSLGVNTNLVVLDDTGWPYGKNTLGKTTLQFGETSGALIDADIQLNTEDYPFALDASGSAIDLVGVLTHETGHALGLDHSDVPGATMQPETNSGFGAADLRSLEPDDMAGICAIYPPQVQAATPEAGTFVSDGLGGVSCEIAARRRRIQGTSSWFSLLCAGLWTRRSARRRRAKSLASRLHGEPSPVEPGR